MKQVAIIFAIIFGALATIITAIFSSGIIVPAVIDFVHPKYTQIETTILLPPQNNLIYPFCVQWQKGQEYRVVVSSDSTPIGVYIQNESQFNELKNNHSFNFNLGAESVFSYSTPFKPINDGIYIVSARNEGNQNAVINMTIESWKNCADFPLVTQLKI